MPVLVICKFEQNLIKHEDIIAESIFSVTSLWEIFHCSSAYNSIANSPIWPKFKLSEILCLSSLPASLTKIRSKLKGLVWRHSFPIISQ